MLDLQAAWRGFRRHGFRPCEWISFNEAIMPRTGQDAIRPPGSPGRPVVGVSKAIGLFFAYYLLTNIANTIGGRGLLTPEAAAWLPDLFMAGVAGWFLVRMR